MLDRSDPPTTNLFDTAGQDVARPSETADDVQVEVAAALDERGEAVEFNPPGGETTPAARAPRPRDAAAASVHSDATDRPRLLDEDRRTPRRTARLAVIVAVVGVVVLVVVARLTAGSTTTSSPKTVTTPVPRVPAKVVVADHAAESRLRRTIARLQHEIESRHRPSAPRCRPTPTPRATQVAAPAPSRAPATHQAPLARGSAGAEFSVEG